MNTSEGYETIYSPGAVDLIAQRSVTSGVAKRNRRYVSLRDRLMRYSSPSPQQGHVRKVKVFRRIASASEGIRDERSLASFLVRKPKRGGNNFTGQSGLERCTFCIKAKKKVLHRKSVLILVLAMLAG
jgi:hypothetical protein